MTYILILKAGIIVLYFSLFALRCSCSNKAAMLSNMWDDMVNDIRMPRRHESRGYNLSGSYKYKHWPFVLTFQKATTVLNLR